MSKEIKENPLINLIGVWQGDKGTDLAPKPVEDENNPYYETLTFMAVDIEIENAGIQELIAVRYHQVVTEKESRDISHDESGYWIWNQADDSIMLSFAIPRGVSVVASGNVERSGPDSDTIKLNVSADLEEENPGIAQSAFMKKNAKTTRFVRKLKLSGDSLSYTQETTVEIYNKVFNHADDNSLIRVIIA